MLLQSEQETILDPNDAQYIRNELDRTLERLHVVEDAFNSVVDEKLIESCIYEQKALLLRIEYLVRLAAENNISCDTFNITGKD